MASGALAGGMSSQSGVHVVLSRASAFGNETGALANGEFAPGPATLSFLADKARVLVIGAGGLGCELLKGLALSGFRRLHVIDLDTIDVTNLNRQFLFRAGDVGRMKAEVAAQFIMRRVPECRVEYDCCPIQDKSAEFFRQFSVIIAGLDNIKARRWLNSLLVSMVETDDEGNIQPESIIPLIDGGSEAFKGQARVILPRLTSCFECSMDSFPPQVHFPLCTVAETPRKPDHCIAYILFAIQRQLANADADVHHERFLQRFGSDKLDKDNAEHMHFIFEAALERAQRFKIEGVTYMLTMGVVKNIIPAVASTNAIIAGACVNECFKLLSWGSQTLNSYFMYTGDNGVYTYTFEYAKKEGCLVCDTQELRREVDPDMTLADFIESLTTDATLQLEKPSVGMVDKKLFMQAPEPLRRLLEPNLRKPMRELCASGDTLTVTDPVCHGLSVDVVVTFAAQDTDAAAPAAAAAAAPRAPSYGDVLIE